MVITDLRTGVTRNKNEIILGNPYNEAIITFQTKTKIMKQLPTSPDGLQPGKIDTEYIKSLGISTSIIPIEYRNFDIGTALKLFKEALEVLKNALSIWERIKILFGGEAPKLSDSDKVSIIKDITVISTMDKSERKNYLANKLIK